MKTSVIIPTYNGRNKLPIILRSLKTQEEQPDEIIVVIDGSTDGSEVVLEQLRQEIPMLKVVAQENKGRAAVRNKGAMHATGDLLIFFDDDMRLLPDVVKKHKLFHKDHPGSILVGRAMLDPKFGVGDDFTRYRVEVERSWNKDFQTGLNAVSFQLYAFTTQNLSCSKSVFNKIGGFDERLKDSEDFDFSVRALLNKIKIFYDYNLLAWHDDIVVLDKYINRQKEYIKSKLMLAELKPHYKEVMPGSFQYGVQIKSVPKALRQIFIFNKIWAKILGSVIYVKLVPKFIRYKLYDLIITLTAANRLKDAK